MAALPFAAEALGEGLLESGVVLGGETIGASFFIGIGALYTAIGVGSYYTYKKYMRGDMIHLAEASLKSVGGSLRSLGRRGRKLVAIGQNSEDEAVKVLVQAYMTAAADSESGNSMSWLLGDLSEASLVERRDFLKFWMTFYYQLACTAGLAFGVRRTSWVTTGELVGVTLLCPPDKDFDDETVRDVLSKMDKEMPTKPEGVLKRITAYGKALKQLKAQCAPKNSYFVSHIGVVPSAQGSGCCREMLGLVDALADRDEVSCYLTASGSKTVTQLKHLGYVTLQTHSLACEPTPEEDEGAKENGSRGNGEDPRTVTIVAMQRPCKSAGENGA
jgi:hypothetical protein